MCSYDRGVEAIGQHSQRNQNVSQLWYHLIEILEDEFFWRRERKAFYVKKATSVKVQRLEKVWWN